MQLLILADIVMESMVTTSKGPVIIPTSKLTEKQRANISGVITAHLETLVERIEKNRPSKLEIIDIPVVMF